MESDYERLWREYRERQNAKFDQQKPETSNSIAEVWSVVKEWSLTGQLRIDRLES